MNDTTPDSAAPPKDSLRLFIALALPEPALEDLILFSKSMQKGAAFTGCRMRWADATSLHLTLAFLGPQPVSMVETLGPLLSELAASHPPQRLELRGLGVFPHWHRPTVLWTAVRDRSHDLAALHGELNRGLADLGVKPEDKPFRPHVTLARFKDYRNLSAIERLAHDHSKFRTATFESARLTLFRSDAHPDGPVYCPLQKHRLGGSPPPEKETADAGIDAA